MCARLSQSFYQTSDAIFEEFTVTLSRRLRDGSMGQDRWNRPVIRGESRGGAGIRNNRAG